MEFQLRKILFLLLFYSPQLRSQVWILMHCNYIWRSGLIQHGSVLNLHCKIKIKQHLDLAQSQSSQQIHLTAITLSYKKVKKRQIGIDRVPDFVAHEYNTCGWHQEKMNWPDRKDVLSFIFRQTRSLSDITCQGLIHFFLAFFSSLCSFIYDSIIAIRCTSFWPGK